MEILIWALIGFGLWVSLDVLKAARKAAQPTPPPPRETRLNTTKTGEVLTEWEMHFIKMRMEQGTFCCPDCGRGHFLSGAGSHLSVNLRCTNKLCGSRFNAFPPPIDRIERISDASPAKPDTRGPLN